MLDGRDTAVTERDQISTFIELMFQGERKIINNEISNQNKYIFTRCFEKDGAWCDTFRQAE